MTEAAVDGSPGLGGLLGRQSELARLRADIDGAGLDTMAGRPAPRSRVLLVAGRPGSGRTALAEEFAQEQLATGRYPDGLLRARLTDPGGEPVPLERVTRELLTALDVPAPAGADEDDLTDVLRTALAGHRALLLLDDVKDAGQLAELIPDTRDCLVLAVSRGPLTGIPDVRPCTLGALDPSAALSLLRRGAGEIRITVDPTAADRLIVACGGLPAAVVLVAGWLAMRPESTIAEALAKITRPDDADGLGGAEDPVALAFRLVYAALPSGAARTLRLMALAPSGVLDAHTVAALTGCALGAARGALDNFALLGLVRPAPPGGERGEYRVPGALDPLLRTLLRTRERPAEVLLARARMLERAVRRLRACQAVTEPLGSPARQWLSGLPAALRFEDPADAARWLAARLPALTAAARMAVADGGDLDTLARRLIGALAGALLAHRDRDGAAPELYRLHELVLDVATRRDLAGERAAALLGLGDLDLAAGRPVLALERYRAALDAARADRGGPDGPLAARALESVGDTYAELADWQRAADWYGRALAIQQSRDEPAAVARLHGRIGAALTRTRHWTEALRAWRAAAAAHRRGGDRLGQAAALADLATVQEYAGRPQEALRSGEEALRLAGEAGDPELAVQVRLLLARMAERMGRMAQAARYRAAGSGAALESSAVTEDGSCET
ncbi:tetratricopeptide repeat protein [Streptomyces xiamenensis]